MTATLVAPTRRTGMKPRLWRCGFCASKNHGSCPGAVWHQRKVPVEGKKDAYRIEPTLWRCLCDEPGHPTFPYCTTCKNDHPDEVNPETWLCLDPYVCAGKVEVRRKNDRVYQMVLAAKVHSSVQRRIRRLAREQATPDLAGDLVIERMHDILDSIENAKKKTRPRPPRAPKPTVGSCECCGEPTRGGRFLPGHDAKLVSRLLARIRSGGTEGAEAYAEMERRNWLNKIPAKLRGKP